MLFNSFLFIFFFFPAAIAGYFLLGNLAGKKPANAWLVIMSFVFYGWWDIRYLPLLLGSIAMNYVFSGFILKFRGQKPHLERIFFWLGISADILLLGYYKYTDFFLENINVLFNADITLLHIILPLGISFFTITQILYLIDCDAGTVKDHDLIDYALFVSFFPHLLAGPILYHRQMMKQFRDETLCRINFDNLSSGLSLFIIGLAKKVIIADSFSNAVGWYFANTADIALAHAWITAVCYMLQLYFDFSGYSDMAIGLAKMLNIKIPFNFNAPYRAASIINFWQRWHISLTNAITACIYTPIMRRFGDFSLGHTAFASFAAFFLAGIWHGAGWNYVIFGLIHGGAVAVNQLWRKTGLSLGTFFSHALTLLTVLASLVFFRAPTAEAAFDMLNAMTGLGARESYFSHSVLTGEIFADFPTETMFVAVLLIIFAPPSQEIVKRMPKTALTAATLAVLFAYSILHLNNMTEFLYFQF